MKLEKIKLTELVDAELNEREMCRILGGGIPGCCQCGCHYATSGGSSTSSNDSANSRDGLRSDPEEQPCCDDLYGPRKEHAQDNTCPEVKPHIPTD